MEKFTIIHDILDISKLESGRAEVVDVDYYSDRLLNDIYLILDPLAKKKGLDPRDFASAAVKRCGLSQGADLVKKGKTDSLRGLHKTLFTVPARLVFEMKILESTDDKLSIDFHYCPLVKAWQKAGCTDEEIAMLCDIAMCGDHGIGECYGSVLDLPKCIAKGDDVCSLRYRKVKSEE